MKKYKRPFCITLADIRWDFEAVPDQTPSKRFKKILNMRKYYGGRKKQQQMLQMSTLRLHIFKPSGPAKTHELFRN